MTTSQILSPSALLAAVSYEGPVLDRVVGLYEPEAVKAIEQAASRLGWRVLPKGIGQSYRHWLPRAGSRGIPRSLKGLCKRFCTEAEPVEPSAPWVFSVS